MLFHHEVNDFLPTLPVQTLLSDQAFGVAGNAAGIGLCRAFSRHEQTEARGFRLVLPFGLCLSRSFACSQAGNNDESGSRADDTVPDCPGDATMR